MQWKIRLFGIVEAHQEDGQVETWRGTKAGLLLAYLALQPDRPYSRESLAELLWPDGDPGTKRTRLRQEIATLRTVLGESKTAETGLLEVSRTEVGLRHAALTTDVAQWRQAQARSLKASNPADREAALQEAIALYRADLLTDYPDHFLSERSRCLQQYEDTLRQLAALQQNRGDLTGAVETLKRLAARDPLCETTHLHLMRLYAELGQPASARRQYQELEKVTREQLGEEPTTGAKQLLLALRERTELPPAVASGLPEPEIAPEQPPAAPVALPEPPAETPPVSAPAPRPRLGILFPGLAALAVVLVGISLSPRSRPPAEPTADARLPLRRNQESWVYYYQPQPGEKANAEARAVGITGDNHIIVTGLIRTDKEDVDILTLRLSSDGKLLWSDRYSSPEHDCDRAFTLAVGDKGGVYVGGETYVPGSAEKEGWYFTLIKYSDSGERLWVRRSPTRIKLESHRMRVLPDRKGGVYLLGTGLDGETQKIAILRYDATGKLLWQKMLAAGDGTRTVFGDALTDEEGRLFVCGSARHKEGEAGVRDGWVTAHYDATGRQQWVRSIPETGGAGSLAQDRFHNLYVGGIVATGDPGEGGQGLVQTLLRYNSDGTLVWKRMIRDTGPSVQGGGIAVDFLNGAHISVAGVKRKASGETAISLSRYDAEGNRWAQTEYPPAKGFRSSDTYLVGTSILGETLIVGELSDRPASQGSDLLTLLYNPDGTIRWQYAYDSGGAGPDSARAMTASDTGLFVVGQSVFSEQDARFLVLKYPQNHP